MEATIEVTGLCKRFGQTVALDQLSFTVAPGQVTGFVGPNGAGKSTTMRVILGLDAADAGGRTGACATRFITSGRCWTPGRCSRAAAPATICCGWPTRRAWAPVGWMR